METHKGIKPHIIIVVRQRQAPTPFHHCFSVGSNLSQLQLTTIKLQLDREAPTSSICQKKCLLIYLRYQLCSVAYPSAPLFLVFSTSIFYTLLSLSLLSLSIPYAYQVDIIYRVHHITVFIPQGI